MKATEIKAKIAGIDRQADAITRKLCRLGTIDKMSCESWQTAWDKHPDLYEQFNALYRQRGELQNVETEFEIHTHSFVSGPRSHGGYRNGKQGDGKITHSHPGGSVAHTHPNTGPSYYGHVKPKVTAKPTGEQFETIPRTDEENTFDLVITDSAKYFNEKNEHVPIGNMPLENISMFAAETMKRAFRMKCNVRDERTKVN